MTRPTLRAISASQIKSFRACPRKWGWDKLVGVDRGPDTPAQALGSRTHEILEDWLEHGTPPDPREAFTYTHPRSPTEVITVHPGQIAQAGLHLLPAPKTVHVEAELHLKTKVGAYYGRIDVHGLDPDGVPFILDHKTTAGFRYALTPATLAEDVQALLYAAWAMVHYKTDKVRLRWIYYLTRGKPKAKQVETTVTAAEIADALAGIDQTAAILWEAYRRGLHAIDLPPRVSSCRDYGGCQYAALCDLTPEQVLEATMSESSNENPASLDDLLASMGVTPAAPTTVGGAPPPPAPPPPPAIQGNVHDGGPTPPINVPCVLSKGTPGYGLPAAPPATPQALINPPEAPAPTKDAPPPRADKPPAAPVSRPGLLAGRAEVKAYAVQIGVVDTSSRLGLPKLWEAIEGAVGPRNATPPPPPLDGPPTIPDIPAVPRAPTIPIAGGALDRSGEEVSAIQTATGSNLDRLGALYRVAREEALDSDYRERIAAVHRATEPRRPDYPNPIQVAGRRLADLWTAESPEDAAKVEAVMDLVVAFLGEVARRG